MAQALDTVSKLDNQHNSPSIETVLKLLQSVVPELRELVGRKEIKRTKGWFSRDVKTTKGSSNVNQESMRALTCAIPHNHKI